MSLHYELTKYVLELLPNPPRATSVRCASVCSAVPAVGADMFVMLSHGVADHWPP
jgi:LSD1 subclass zinc finger protein